MKRIIAVLLLVSILFTVFTGCGGKKEEATTKEGVTSGEVTPKKKTKNAVVILVGKHAQAKEYPDMEKILESELKSAVEFNKDKKKARINANIVVVDGKPEVDETLKVKETISGANVDGCRNEVAGKIKDIIKDVMSDKCKANDEEVDLLEGISVAERILDSYSDKYNKKIVIMDTGICTTGYLDMRRMSFSNEGIEEAVANADKGLPVKKIEGTSIYFYGMGSVGGSQTWPANKDIKINFEELWKKIFINAGVKEEDIHFKANGDSNVDNEYLYLDDKDGYPYVRTILFPRDTFCDFQNPNGDEPAINVVINNSELGFVANSTKFKDEDQAEYIIKSLVEHIKTVIGSGNKIYIVGSIAKTQKVPDAKNDPCSLGRAQAVADILINTYGVDSEKIVVLDAGTTELSWRNAVDFKDGRYYPKEQEKNRLVAIISSNSTDLVKELNDKGIIK